MGQSSGGGIQMQPDQLTSLGAEVTELAQAVQKMSSFGNEEQLSGTAFGNIGLSQNIGGEVVNAIKSLATQIGYAATFLAAAGPALQKAASATTATDEQADWTITGAGQGVSS